MPTDDFEQFITRRRGQRPAQPLPPPSSALDDVNREDFEGFLAARRKTTGDPSKPIPSGASAADQARIGPVRKQSPFAPQGTSGIIGQSEQIASNIGADTRAKQQRIEQEARRYAARSPLGQASEVATSGVMRGAEGLIKAAKTLGPMIQGPAGIPAAVASTTKGLPGQGSGVLTPDAQAALDEQGTGRAQIHPWAAPIGEGVASALTQAPAYMLAGQAGLPAVAALTAAQEDWSDPATAARRATLNTLVPAGLGKGASLAARPLVKSMSTPVAREAVHRGAETIGGGVGNVAQTAIVDTTDPRELAKSAVIGGLVSGATANRAPQGPMRLPAPKMMRPTTPVETQVVPIPQGAASPVTPLSPNASVAPSDLATRPRASRMPATDIDLSRHTVAEYAAKVDQINQSIPAGPERIAALQQARAEYQAARRGVLPEDVQRFIPKPEPAQVQAQPGTEPLTAPLTEGLTPDAPETQVLPQTPTDPRRNLVDQTRAKADAALSEGRYSDAISELKAHQEALKQLKRSVGKDAPGERVRIEREIGRTGNQIGEVRKQAREAARSPKPETVKGVVPRAEQPPIGDAPTRDLTAPLRRTEPLQEPTNQIRTGAGDEMPREVGRQMEGQPIETPTRYTEYEGGELARYSRPLDGQPAEIPAQPVRPQTAELAEPDYIREAPPPISDAESFRSPEDARRGKFEFMEDAELDSAIKQLEDTRNAGIRGKSNLDPQEQHATEIELQTAKAVRRERLSIQRQQGREPGERLKAYAGKFRFQDETLHRMAREFYNKHGYYPNDEAEVRAGRPLKDEAPPTMEAVRRNPLPDPEQLTDERLEKLIRDGEKIRENATDPPADTVEWLEKAKREREKRQGPKNEPEVQAIDQWSRFERAKQHAQRGFQARHTTGAKSIEGRSKREQFTLSQETLKPSPDFADALRKAYPQSSHGQERYSTIKRFKVGDESFFAGLNKRTNLWEIHAGDNDAGPRLSAINPIDIENAPITKIASDETVPQAKQPAAPEQAKGPEAVPEAKPSTAKKPGWQMTAGEYADSRKQLAARLNVSDARFAELYPASKIETEHRKQVIDAAASGEIIPAQVLDSLPSELVEHLRQRYSAIPEGYKTRFDRTLPEQSAKVDEQVAQMREDAANVQKRKQSVENDARYVSDIAPKVDELLKNYNQASNGLKEHLQNDPEAVNALGQQYKTYTPSIRSRVESARQKALDYLKSLPDETRQRATEQLSSNAPDIFNAPQDAPTPKPARTIQHSDFGEVTPAENQRGVARGKLRVVDASGTEHIIQKPTAGKGNRRAAMAKAAPVLDIKQAPPEVRREFTEAAESHITESSGKAWDKVYQSLDAPKKPAEVWEQTKREAKDAGITPADHRREIERQISLGNSDAIPERVLTQYPDLYDAVTGNAPISKTEADPSPMSRFAEAVPERVEQGTTKGEAEPIPAKTPNYPTPGTMLKSPVEFSADIVNHVTGRHIGYQATVRKGHQFKFIKSMDDGIYVRNNRGKQLFLNHDQARQLFALFSAEAPPPALSPADAIRAAKPNGGLVRIKALRDAGLSDAAILEAANKGEIALSRGERAINTKGDLLDDGQGNVYVGASVREGGESAKTETPKPARQTPARGTPERTSFDADAAKLKEQIDALEARAERAKALEKKWQIRDQIAELRKKAGLITDKYGKELITRGQVAKYEDAIEDAASPIHRQALESKLAELTRAEGYQDLGKRTYQDVSDALSKEAEDMGLSRQSAELVGRDVAGMMTNSPLSDFYGSKYKDFLRNKVEQQKNRDAADKTIQAARDTAKTALKKLLHLTDDARAKIQARIDRANNEKDIERITEDARTENRESAPVEMGKPVESNVQKTLFKQPQVVVDFLRNVTPERGFKGILDIKSHATTARVRDRLRDLGWMESNTLEPTPEGQRVIQYIADLQHGFTMDSYTPASGTTVSEPGAGWYVAKVGDGREAYSNGHFLLVGKPPAKHKIADRAPDFSHVFNLKDKKATNAKPVEPIGYAGAPSSGLQVVFKNGAKINSDYYDFIKSKFKDAEFYGTTPDNQLFIYSKGEAVGTVMPMRGDAPKALKSLIGQPAKSQGKPQFVADAEARLKDAASGKLAGSGAQAIADQAIVTGYKVYKAGMRFGEWARTVIREAGDSIKPYLRETWKKISSSFSAGSLPDDKPGQTLGGGLGSMQGMFGKRGKAQTSAPTPPAPDAPPVDLPYLRRDNGDAYKQAVSDAIRARTDDAAEIKRIEAMADRAVRANAANSPLGGQIDAQIRRTLGGSTARTTGARSQNVQSPGQPVQPRPAPRGQATQATTKTTTARTARTGVIAPAPTGQSRTEKAASNIGSALSLPRALMASLDVSAPLRQGAILTLPPTQWKRAASAGLKMFQAFSTKQYDRISQEINAHPDAQTAKDAGLYLATDPNAPKSLQGREEDFITKWAGKIPGVKHSEQAYKTYLDSLRIDTFAKYKKAIEKQGGSPEQQDAAIKAAAKWINVATGRGSLGETFDKATPLLSTVFFAPKYVASRVNALNPVMYAKMPSSVRKQAIGDLVQFAGVVGATLALAKAAGAEVSTDPDDADFLKIKVGTTRYDGLAGLQQVMRLFYRVGKDAALAAKGESPVRGQSAFDVTGRFLRSKLAPVPSYFVDALTRKDFIGRDFDAKRGAIERVTPLIWRDYYEAYQREGLGGAAKMTPGMFGIGVADYQKRTGNFELKGEKFSSEARKYGIVYESAQRLKDEPEDLFKARSGKIRDWLDQHGEALISHPRYSSLSDEQKKAAIEALRQRIGQQANQQRPNPSAFAPTRIIAGVLRAERERPSREAGKIYVER